MTSDVGQAYRAAAGLLEAGRPEEAVAVLGPLAAAHPADPAVRHLHGLSLYNAGDPAAAADELRAALAIDDRPAQVHVELAQVLQATGDLEGMAASLCAALERDPRRLDAAVPLAGWLLSQNRPEDALAVTGALAEQSPDPAAISLHAEVLRGLGRFDDAAAVLRRIAGHPGDTPAFDSDLATVLVEAERFAEAEAASDRAIARGLPGPEIRRLRGRALQGLDRFDEAEASFRDALARQRDFAPAHRDLAQLIWMRTESVAAATEALDAAIAAWPSTADLRIIKAQLLDYAGDPEAGYEALAPLVDRPDADPAADRVAAQLALTLDARRALFHAERALMRAPEDPRFLVVAAEASLAAGLPDAAALRARSLLDQAPYNQQAIGLQTTAWRLLGDPRYDALCDYAGLVRPARLEPPEGWSSVEGWLADLSSALNALHSLRAHPVGQSLRHGSQTSQSLDRSTDPAIRGFFDAIRRPIRAYIDGLASAPDVLRTRRAGDFRVSGSWSVKLRPGGRHVNHLHPQGWLSSAFYVALPDAIDKGGREGWISFGEPGVPTAPPLPAEHWVKPEPGMLVLFPSYLWHGTQPFTTGESRMTIAFDVVPEPQ